MSLTREILEQKIQAVLQTYSNVHRGDGHYSAITTGLYEQARVMILQHLELNQKEYQVIFCTPRRAESLASLLKPGTYSCLSPAETGIPLGIRAVAVQRKALPPGIPPESGGGTTRLVAPHWVIWAKPPDRFEAGTPPVINCLAFALALQTAGDSGRSSSRFVPDPDPATASALLHDDEFDGFSGRELLKRLRASMISGAIPDPAGAGSRRFVNLDNAASTQTFRPVWEVVKKVWRSPEQVQREVISETRRICSRFLNAPLDEYEIIFTTNTTEAIHLAAASPGLNSAGDGDTVVLSSLLEHSSNDLPWRRNRNILRIPVTPEGFPDAVVMETKLDEYNTKHLFGSKRIRTVALTGASNVLGTFTDLAGISRLAQAYGALLLVDAAQMIAHRPVDMKGNGIDALVFSAHKAYAPFGCGVLAIRKGLLGYPKDEMEKILKSGEENAGGIAALGKAMLLLERIGFDVIREEEQALTARLLRGLAELNGLTVYGVKDPAAPSFPAKGGVIAFSLKGMMADRLARELAARGGIGIRSGCHCAHMLVKHLLGFSPFMENFQGYIVRLLPFLQLPGIARISLGIGNTGEDADAFLKQLTAIAADRKKDAAAARRMKEFVRTAVDKLFRNDEIHL